MESTTDHEPRQSIVDLTKLSKEELILTIQELIEENKALKDKLRTVERNLYSQQNEQQNEKVDPRNDLTDFDEPTNTMLTDHQDNVLEANDLKNADGSDDSDKNESEKAVEKDEEAIEEIDKEAYFQKMTEIIRENFKSPSMILSKHEADILLGQATKKISKEKSDAKMWEKEIIPYLKDKESREKVILKIKGAIYSFIPSKYRGVVWPKIIGNPLRIKRAMYDNYCKLLEANPVDARITYLIREDLVRTYPSFTSFNRGEALNAELQCLLELFHFARPDIGYVQGMAYPAAMLLMHMDRYHAFKCLVNMIAASPFMVSLYNFQLEKLRRSFKAFDYYLKQKSPAASKHLNKMGIQSETFLIEWYYTLFCRTFTIHDAAKIWDVYLLEGEIVLLRVSLRIFQAVESQLVKKDYAQTLHYIRSCTAEIDIETIFKNMQYSKMTRERLERFFEKEKKKIPIAEKSL